MGLALLTGDHSGPKRYGRKTSDSAIEKKRRSINFAAFDLSLRLPGQTGRFEANSQCTQGKTMTRIDALIDRQTRDVQDARDGDK